MKKTGFKTFVCSFVFSLFIVFAINGVFFHTRRPSTQELKIPNQNIALFFTDEPKTAAPYKVKPVKKIALTIAAKPKENIASLEIQAPAVQTPSPDADNIDASVNTAKLKDTDEIPLEISANDVFEPLPNGKTVKVSNNFEKMIESAPPIDDNEFIIAKEESIPIILSNNDKKERRLTAQANIKEKARKAIQAIEDSGNDTGGGYETGDEDYSTEENEQQNQPKELVLAQADIKENPKKAIQPIEDSGSDNDGGYETDDEDYSTNEPQNLLIPLQRDYANANNRNKIKIEKSPAENQIAMAKGNIPIKSMVSEKDAGSSNKDNDEPQKGKEWETMAEKSGQDSPWVVAKGMKYPKNSAVLNEDYYKNSDNHDIKSALNDNKQFDGGADNGVQLASEMVQNILIPIPEDILNDENLTPQLESSNKANPKEAEVTEREKEKKDAAQVLKDEIDKNSTPSSNKNSKGGLLKSITSIFSGNSSSGGDKKEEKSEDSESSFVDRFTSKLTRPKNATPSKILPAEMRLSFQPNRAEISGTTLKWIQAFANKVNQDSSVILEIRIDGSSSYALQQKRLNLLHNILTNKGVDYSKINTVFTTREPNSFIIRTVRVNSNIDRDVKENKDSAAYYQSW